ncbi:MAG: endonuclease III [Oscillospiraceae bacterium]|jgi:endonuclease-3|nr:endonuclease III [Oscillospiraceae bacterium]
MNQTDLSAKACRAEELLRAEYPDALCSLQYADPFRLLVATRLSAQCTDARVNLVTPALFAAYPDAPSMAAAPVAHVEELIRSCGFYHTKARDLIAMSQMLLTHFGGAVPDSIEKLTQLPGVGRKTANLIMGDVYGKPAIVADTHLIRITNLLGLVNTKNPLQVELLLRELILPERSNDFCHRCVLHGRAVCVARRPRCGQCILAEVCAFVHG